MNIFWIDKSLKPRQNPEMSSVPLRQTQNLLQRAFIHGCNLGSVVVSGAFVIIFMETGLVSDFNLCPRLCFKIE